MECRALSRALACAAVLFVAMAAHAGERWRYVETSRLRDADPTNFMLGADGSLWTFAPEGAHRFDASGNLLAAIFPMESFFSYQQGEPIADNGAILSRFSTFEAGCDFARVDASLRTRWVRRGNCGRFAAFPDGSLWLASPDALLRIGQDGTVVARTSGGGMYNASLATMPDGGVAVTSRGPEEEAGPVARYGTDGTLRWSFLRPTQTFREIASGTDGSVAVAGMDTTSRPALGELLYVRLDAAGDVIGEYRTEGQKASPYALELAGDGSASVLAYADGGYVLYRFGADGKLLWRAPACDEIAPFVDRPLVLLPGGGTVLACSGPDHARLIRFDASGVRIVNATLPTATAQLALRPDGNLQVLGDAWTAHGPRPLYAVDIDGKPVAAPRPQRGETLVVADQKFEADGSSWLVSVSQAPLMIAVTGQAYLSKIGANGALLWRRTFPAAGPLVRLSVAGGQACVTMGPQWLRPWPGMPQPQEAAPVSINCLDASTGAERWTRSFPKDFATHFFSALDDGTFIHVRGDSGAVAHEFFRYDAGGNEIAHVSGNGFARTAGIGTSASAAVVVLEDRTWQRRLVRYDAQGNVRELVGPTIDQFEVADVANDASLVWASTLGPGYAAMNELRSYAADGRLAWTHVLLNFATAVTAVRTGASVHVAASVVPPDIGQGMSRVTRLDANTGRVSWTYLSKSTLPESYPPTRALAVSGDRVALARAGGNRLRLLYLDARDGAVRGEQTVACDGDCGQAQGLALAADGTARVALALASATRGATTALVALDDTSALPPVRLDQPGLAGAWWAPFANGEGFVIDWLPVSRTWFMPWFTFSTSGRNERDAQRWFTIAGTLPAGATQAELPIVQPVLGRFETGGGVAVPVGTAKLKFTDCDNGTLGYAFDPSVNGGATGTITLSRLTPATQDCVLADGAVQSRATTPANGFDARMSGSWLNEATAGQGFEFTVQPGGVFFAPWFTFDPAETSEPGDPGRQRWYTLQGSLADAVNGRVELVIAQALGGAFDSVPATNQFVVGSATLTMQACDRATLDYRFTDDELAADLRGRTGSIGLTRSGGCTP